MPNAPAVQSLARAIHVIDLVAHSKEGLTVQQIAESLYLKRPTVHNLVKTLAEEGVLDRTPDSARFRLGASVLKWAALASAQSLHALAMQSMREIHLRLPDAHLLLAEPRGDLLVTSLHMDPRRPHVIQRPPWDLPHPYGSVVALLFMALADPLARSRFSRRHAFREYASGFWESEAHLERFLNDVRARGYCECAGGVFEKLRVAAPVYGSGHELIAMLAGYVEMADAPRLRERLIHEVISEADAISRDLQGSKNSLQSTATGQDE
jgi:DNA-binding IclR family transcriptional regulator